MYLGTDPKKPSYVKWYVVRTHTRLNSILQKLVPCDDGDAEGTRINKPRARYDEPPAANKAAAAMMMMVLARAALLACAVLASARFALADVSPLPPTS